MAGGDKVISYKLLMPPGDAVASMEGFAAAAQDAARAEAQLALAAKEAAAAQKAQAVAAAEAGYKLQTIAASGSKIESQVLSYRRMRAEIEAMGKASGDAALQARAMEALNKNFAASLPGATKQVAALGAASRTSAGGLRMLATQMPDVISQLSAGANPLTVLTQQGLQVGQQMMTAGGSMASFGGALAAALPLLAVAAVGIASLTAAYAVIKNQVEQYQEAEGRLSARLEETRARTDAASAAALKLAGAWSATQKTVNAQIEDLAVAEGLIDKWTVQASRQTAALQEQSRASIAAKGQQVAASEAEIAALKESIKTGWMFASTRHEMQNRVDSLTESIKSVSKALAEEKKAVADGSTAIKENARLAKEKEEADKRREAAAKAAAEAERELAKLSREQANIREAMLAADRQQREELSAIALIERDLAAGIGGSNDKLEERLRLLSEMQTIDPRRIEEAAGRALQAADVDKGLTQLGLQLEVPDLKPMIDAAREVQRILEDSAKRAGNVLAAIVEGNLSKIVENVLGGAGGAFAGKAVGLLGTLGEQGADATIAKLEAAAQNVLKGLAELPKLLVGAIRMVIVDLPVMIVQSIPEILKSVIIELPRALLSVAADFGRMLWDAITFGDSLRQWWDGMGGWSGITRALRDWWHDVWAAIVDFFTRTDKEKDEAKQRRRDTALEVVTLGFANTDTYNPGAPQSRNQRTASYQSRAGLLPASMGGGGRGGMGGTHIHIHEGVMIGKPEDFARELNRHFGRGGRGLQLNAGSVKS